MESEQATLPGLALAQESCNPADGVASSENDKEERAGKPRFRQIDREQSFWRIVNVEPLIPEDHAARAIEQLCKYDPAYQWLTGTAVVNALHSIRRRPRKVGMEALWACLTYNIRQWIRLRWRKEGAVATATA